MALFDNLFGYARERRYDFHKTRKDERLNSGYDYEKLPPGEFLGRAVSGHIQRNETMQHFMMFMSDAVLNLLKSARYLKKYKNYTVKPDDKQTR